MAFSDFQTGWGHAVKTYRQMHNGGKNVITVGQVALANQALLTSQQQQAMSAGYAGIESAAAGWPTSLATASKASWFELAADEIGRPFQSDAQFADDMVRHMDGAGIYVAGRVVTYGANPADNVVGIHRRLTVNKYGHKIENGSHNIPNGITMRVVRSEVSGGTNGQTVVSYEGGNITRASSLRVKGVNVIPSVTAIGPLNLGLSETAQLNGNTDVADNAAITDGDADTGGILGFNQTRTGTPTVTVDTTNKWKDQEYGVAIGGASVALELDQPLEDWDLQALVPVAYALPVYMNGASLNVDIVTTMGTQTDSWDETDLTNGAWTTLLSTLDENLYPENFDDTDSKFSVKATLNAGSTGECIFGGVYAVNGFQLNPAGEWHFLWEREITPTLFAEVSYGADSQTDAGELQEAWCQVFPNGPSLPVSGSSLWTLP